MKAAQIHEYGDVSVVSIVDIEKPSAQEGQVVVEVHSASLNPFDSTVRAGYMQQTIPLTLPVTLGGDIAGIVTQVGPGAEGFAVGDMIYGQANVVAGNSGAFAEYAATSVNQIAIAPRGLGFNELASLPLVGVSALQAVTQHLAVQPGQKIFINGGAGGIGQVAVQIAKHLGAYVAVTATGEGIAIAKALGADEIIDYKMDDFASILKDYDAAFDTVGGELFTKCLHVLKRGGIAVSMAGQADEKIVSELGVTAIHQFTKVTTEALDTLRALVEDGVVKPHVSKAYSLNEIRQAFTARESGMVNGKVVLEIKK